MNVVEKKTNQLGMNPSTASGRLVKDLLYNFVVQTGSNTCYRCGEAMTRETFSIEHKKSWLDSEDPVGLFFDIGNISYSHKGCNAAAASDSRVKAGCGTRASYVRGCRCDECRSAANNDNKRFYTPERRRNTYLRTGH